MFLTYGWQVFSSLQTSHGFPLEYISDFGTAVHPRSVPIGESIFMMDFKIEFHFMVPHTSLEIQN